ncbi:MAG: hypothetical protein ACRC6Z_07130 [Cetobacterium sp.]
MVNKKMNVLDRLKQDSFKKKETHLNKQPEIKEFEITVIEKDFLPETDVFFDYNDIQGATRFIMKSYDMLKVA